MSRPREQGRAKTGPVVSCFVYAFESFVAGQTTIVRYGYECQPTTHSN